MRFEDDDDVDREPFNDPSPAPELDGQLATLCDSLARAGLTKVEVFYQRRRKKWRLTGTRYRPQDLPVAPALQETLHNLAEAYCRRALNLDGTAGRPPYRTTARRGTLTLYPGERQAKLRDVESSQETETGPCRMFPLPARMRKPLAALRVTTLRVSFTLHEHTGHVKELTTQPVPIQIEEALRKELEAFIFKHLPTSLKSKHLGWVRSTHGFGTVDIEVEDSRAVPDLNWVIKEAPDEVIRWQVRVPAAMTAGLVTAQGGILEKGVSDDDANDERSTC